MILTLIQKEFILELRRKAVISGISLYLVSIIFICYLTFSLRQSSINEATWSALFWLSILFANVNGIAKSFIGEKKGLMIYYYSIASPQAIILSKIIYNVVLSVALALMGYLLFSIFIDNPLQDKGLFMLTLLLSSFGFSACLEFDFGNCLEDEQQQYSDGSLELSRDYCTLADGDKNNQKCFGWISLR